MPSKPAKRRRREQRLAATHAREEKNLQQPAPDTAVSERAPSPNAGAAPKAVSQVKLISKPAGVSNLNRLSTSFSKTAPGDVTEYEDTSFSAFGFAVSANHISPAVTTASFKPLTALRSSFVSTARGRHWKPILGEKMGMPGVRTGSEIDQSRLPDTLAPDSVTTNGKAVLGRRVGKCDKCGRMGHIARFCYTLVTKDGKALGPNTARRDLQSGLQFQHDNEGMSRFRAGNPPDSIIEMKRNFNPPDMNGPTSRFSRIAFLTGTHIVVRSKKHTLQCNIWGLAGLETAREEVLKWQGEVAPPGSHQDRMFDRVNAQDWISDTVEIGAKGITSESEKFTLNLPADGLAAFARVLPWNMEQSPEDSLGRNLEALDPIRKRFEVHINILRPRPGMEKYHFLLIGDREQLMNQAIARIINIHHQVAARRLTPFALHLVKEFNLEHMKSNSVFGKHSIVKVKDVTRKDPAVHIGDTLCLGNGRMTEDDWIQRKESQPFAYSLQQIEPGSVIFGAPHARRINTLYLTSWISNRLKRLRYYSGFLRMRVNIGVCIFTVSPSQKDMETEGLREMIHECNTEQHGLQSISSAGLGNKSYESNLLHRFLDAKDFTLTNVSHDECGPIPIVQLTFVIGSMESREKDFRLEMTFNRNSSVGASTRWSHMSAKEAPRCFADDYPFDAFRNTRILDVKMLDIRDPALSYTVYIETRDHIDMRSKARWTIPGAYLAFANKVSVDWDKARDVTVSDKFVDFDAGTCVVPLKYVEQKRVWEFTAQDYIIEVSQTQIVRFPAARQEKLQMRSGEATDVFEPHWGVQVHHQVWDLNFQANSKLGVGERAKWGEKEWQWFRPELADDLEGSYPHNMRGLVWRAGQGVEDMLKVLDAVSDLITGKSGTDRSEWDGKQDLITL